MVSELLQGYSARVAATDVLGPAIGPVMMGLFGEVGGIMASAKKVVREGEAYPGFRDVAQEEFGDAAWYFAALCRRLDVAFAQISLQSAESGNLHETLISLGQATARLLRVDISETPTDGELSTFLSTYLHALSQLGLNVAEVLAANEAKATGAFLLPDHRLLPVFDEQFEEEERIPRRFAIRVTQRKSGRSYLQWNNVFVGDPLTDNAADEDGYRFHDVFHLAHAAVLHWSPVFRALIKQKRKSIKHFDEVEDGGRAIVVEEGLTAWIFSRSKRVNHFDGQTRVSMDILKTIQEFIRGYEVERCPLKLWERAILEGYAAFRALQRHRGGWIVGDLLNRSIRFSASVPQEAT